MDFRWARLLSLCVAGVIALSGCSGDSDEEPSSDADKETSVDPVEEGSGDEGDGDDAPSGEVVVDAGALPKPPEIGNEEDDGLYDMAMCIKERGWDVDVDYNDNSIGIVNSSADQAAQYRDDMWECSEIHSPPITGEPLTDEEVREYYDFHVETYHCLLGIGEAPEEPPSYQKYLEDMRAQLETWEPYGTLDLTRDSYERLIVECPPAP